jgi:hypothetical protein
MTARLEKWSVFPAYNADPRVLVGHVYGHPRHTDGKLIRTSTVTGAEGRRVQTVSGTEYELGEAAETFAEVLVERVPDWDPENPLNLPSAAKGQS